MKHTLGPWQVERDGYNPYILDNTMLVRIADVCRIENTGIEGNTRANAALIAASPTLLAACKGAIAALSQNKTFQTDIDAAKSFLQAAVDKAEGGTP